MKFCHLKPNKFQLLLHDYITKNNKHLYLLSTSLSFYFADIKVFIVIFIKKFAKDAYYNLLMLGIQSPVGILRISPTHIRKHPRPPHTHPHPHTHTHPLIPTDPCTPMYAHAYPCTLMHTHTNPCTPTPTHAHPHMIIVTFVSFITC